MKHHHPIMAALIALMLGQTTVARADTIPNAIISIYTDLNELCRGGAGDVVASLLGDAGGPRVRLRKGK